MIESTIAPAPILSSPQQSRTKKRTNRSRSQWKSLLDDFNRSGLTKVVFCKMSASWWGLLAVNYCSE